MTIKLTDFKPENYLTDSETHAHFLEDALATGNSGDVRRALHIIAKARGIESLANEIGMSKQGLYKAFGENGDPKLSTLLKIANALGVSLSLKAVNDNHASDAGEVYNRV